MSESIRKIIKHDLWCAEHAISGLLDRTRRWQVSIPVQDDDTDVILSKPIGHARHLLSEVERLTASYDALVTEGLQSAAKYEQLIADLQAERDALEAEASVYRVTVLGVNVAAGQGED